MQNKAEVQAVVETYLRQADISVSELARRAGIPGATLSRMLQDDPTYRGTPETWTQLAQYAPLGLDVADVLAALGFGPRPRLDGQLPSDPWVLLEQTMRAFEFPEDMKGHLRGQVRLLLQLSQLQRQYPPSSAQ